MRNRSAAEALGISDAVEEQRGRILEHFFPGLMVFGWAARAKCLARMARFDDSLRIYRQVQAYWLNSAPNYATLQRYKDGMVVVEREARSDRFLGDARASDHRP